MNGNPFVKPGWYVLNFLTHWLINVQWTQKGFKANSLCKPGELIEGKGLNASEFGTAKKCKDCVRIVKKQAEDIAKARGIMGEDV